ncbi:MAG TPA: triose-phosphate isomerase [Clostridia bacterium]|nr:triose-phosphate isomerase [Clostridia bacterium]
MRRKVIAANWKMFKTVGEARKYIEKFKTTLAEGPEPGVDVLLFPPFTALQEVATALKGSYVGYGAQNMYWEDEGAYTGEISPGMLSDLGCTHVLLGHSERRQFFGETDETVNKKAKVALKHGLIPIVCVGEKIEDREAGNTETVVRAQLEGSLKDLGADDMGSVIIAYEPIWAIGTGRTASENDAQEVNAFIRRVVAGMVGEKAAEAVRIQYGGSVKPDNAPGLMSQPDIDGALVGGAGLDPVSFAAIVRAAE